MRQLFQNLVANAIKFHKKGEAPFIRIQGRPGENGFAEVVVQDEGVGFDGNYADRIFKPFERLHSRSDYEGSGIGLAICKKIVDHHGGDIKVKSSLGQGTVFTVRLPKADRGTSHG